MKASIRLACAVLMLLANPSDCMLASLQHGMYRNTAALLKSRTKASNGFLLRLGQGPSASQHWQHICVVAVCCRAAEYEADAIGIRLLAKACYDPQANITMLQKLNSVTAKQEARMPEILSTHPITQASGWCLHVCCVTLQPESQQPSVLCLQINFRAEFWKVQVATTIFLLLPV